MPERAQTLIITITATIITLIITIIITITIKRILINPKKKYRHIIKISKVRQPVIGVIKRGIIKKIVK